MGSLRRSEFLRCVPAALWSLACGESPASGNGASTTTGGIGSSGGSASGGVSGGTAGGGAEPAASGGAEPGSGGSSGGAHAMDTSGGQPAASTGGAATTSGGAGVAGAPAASSCGADLGATAGIDDFSMNTDTGQMDAHVLMMSKGDIIRRISSYQSSGEADHQHEFFFTDQQLVALLAGEGVVVETQGPPLNAAAGHAHTVRVHACKA